MQCEQQGWIKTGMLLADVEAERVMGCDIVEE